jgi:hypothetical protein
VTSSYTEKEFLMASETFKKRRKEAARRYRKPKLEEES